MADYDRGPLARGPPAAGMTPLVDVTRRRAPDLPISSLDIIRYVTIREGICGWCDNPFHRTGPGRVGLYCSAAHRQAAFRYRHDRDRDAGPGTVGLPAELRTAIEQLAGAVDAPGEYSTLAVWSTALHVIDTAGVARLEQPPDPDPPPALADQARYARPRAWTGSPLPAPARVNPRWYERTFDEKTGWDIRVRALRQGRPFNAGKLLRSRQHPQAGLGPHTYTWADRWGVPNTANLHRLAGALLADAIDLPGGAAGALARRSQLGSVIAAYFTGDVLYPLGDTTWRFHTTELVTWLHTHHYLPPIVT